MKCNFHFSNYTKKCVITSNINNNVCASLKTNLIRNTLNQIKVIALLLSRTEH